MERRCLRLHGKEITVLLDSGTSNTILASDLRLVLNKCLVKIKNCQLTRWTQAADMTKHCVDGQIVIPITLECRTRDVSFLVAPTMEETKYTGLSLCDILWRR